MLCRKCRRVHLAKRLHSAKDGLWRCPDCHEYGIPKETHDRFTLESRLASSEEQVRTLREALESIVERGCPQDGICVEIASAALDAVKGEK